MRPNVDRLPACVFCLCACKEQNKITDLGLLWQQNWPTLILILLAVKLSRRPALLEVVISRFLLIVVGGAAYCVLVYS